MSELVSTIDIRPQIILADEQRGPINYYFLPNEIKRPILPTFFDSIVDSIPKSSKFVAFWADGDIIAANPWRELLEAFTAWQIIKDYCQLLLQLHREKHVLSSHWIGILKIEIEDLQKFAMHTHFLNSLKKNVTTLLLMPPERTS